MGNDIHKVMTALARPSRGMARERKEVGEGVEGTSASTPFPLPRGPRVSRDGSAFPPVSDPGCFFGSKRADLSSGKREEEGVEGSPRRDPSFGTFEVSGHRGRAWEEPKEAGRDWEL